MTLTESKRHMSEQTIEEKIITQTETGEIVAVQVENEVIYGNPKDAKKVLEEQIPTEHKIDTPLDLIAECPRIAEGEVVSLPTGYVVAIDCPGYTYMMNTFPDEATNLYLNVRNTMADKVATESAYQNAIQLTNAGDETLSLFPQYRSSPLEVIAFCLEYQVELMQELHKSEYDHVREYLQTHKESHTPTISAGIAYGSLTAKAVELAEDPMNNESSGARLLVTGPELIVKAMGGQKGHFIMHDVAMLETAEFEISSLSDSPPEVIMSKDIPDQYKLYLKSISAAALKIVEPDNNGVPFYKIEAPDATTPEEVLSILKSAVKKLKEEAVRLRKAPEVKDPYLRFEFMPIRTLDIKKSQELAKKFCVPQREESDINNSQGEVAFYDIQGLNNLRQELREKFDDRIASLITTDAATFIAKRISEVTVQEQWFFENIESDPTDAARFVLEHNILAPDMKNQGKFLDNMHIMDAIVESIHALKDPSFKNELLEYLLEKHGENINSNALQKILKEISFKTTIGLVTCEDETDQLTWVKRDNKDQKRYAWWRVIGGSAPSAAARYNGLGSHSRINDRIEELKKKEDLVPLTSEEQQSKENMMKNRTKVEELTKGDCIVMQKSIAQAYGLLETDENGELINPDVVMIEKMYLKGMKLTDPVIWSPKR